MPAADAKSSPRNSKTKSHRQHTSIKSNKTSASSETMTQLNNKILESLAKLSDRDTYRVAVVDLGKIIQTVPPQGFTMLLNCLLYDSPPLQDLSTRHSPAIAKRECLRLLTFLCSTHSQIALPHLSKIISHVVRCIKDSSSDTSVRDACRNAVGSLSRLYLGTIYDPSAENYSSHVSQFVNPFLEIMGQQNKGVQAAAALCLVKVIDCAVGDDLCKERSNAVGLEFQDLVPKICKLLDTQSFINKSTLLSVVSSLSQVGAITQQEIQTLLQLILQCMRNSDWTTRKASADALSVLAITSSAYLDVHWVSSMISAIEACRFDKLKPVRDSMAEALGLWKKLVEEEDNSLDRRKSLPGENQLSSTCSSPQESVKVLNKKLPASFKKKKLGEDEDNALDRRKSLSGENQLSSTCSSPQRSVKVLKKKLPASFKKKKINPNFFRNLEITSSDDLPPVQKVVLPYKHQDLQSEGEEEKVEVAVEEKREENEEGESNNSDGIHGNPRSGVQSKKIQDQFEYGRDRLTEKKVFNIKDSKLKCLDSDDMGSISGFCRRNIDTQGSMFTITKRLSQLERQQADLLNMLQDFMGNSRESMVILDNRVEVLERVVNEMAKDLAMSYMKSSHVRMPYSQRHPTVSGMRRRDPHWDSSGLKYSSLTGRTRRSWGKEFIRHGPSIRSVWQDANDEATLEAIRGVRNGEGDDEMCRTDHQTPLRKSVIAEFDSEALIDHNKRSAQEMKLRNCWIRALDWIHAGDVDSAYAEILSTEDINLLTELMVHTGPLVNQLSNEIMNKVLGGVVPYFLAEQNLRNISLAWISQLTELVVQNGAEYLDAIDIENKREILFSLYDACRVGPSEDWDEAIAEQMMVQLATSWRINIHELMK